MLNRVLDYAREQRYAGLAGIPRYTQRERSTQTRARRQDGRAVACEASAPYRSARGADGHGWPSGDEWSGQDHHRY